MNDVKIQRWFHRNLKPEPSNCLFEAWVKSGWKAGLLMNKLLRLNIMNFAVHVNETRPDFSKPVIEVKAVSVE